MKLFHYQPKVANFGDDLNNDLWPALAPHLFSGDPSHAFQGIGTIIGMPCPWAEQVHVFSSGVGYLPPEGDLQKRKIWCVRGPRTAAVLGIDPSFAITDGAILSPYVFKKSSMNSTPVVIPHWESLHGDWQAACDLAGLRLVSPVQTPTAAIAEITSAPLVLTESLHGAIIADTYGIPWVPFTTNGNFSLFKWLDWTQSVDLSLDLNMVPPPSGETVYRLGMPRLGKFGDHAMPSEAAVNEEVARRLTAAPGQSAKRGAVSGLRAIAKQAALLTPAARAFGLYPESTARSLRKLVLTARPVLSRPQVRTDLTERMLSQLDALSCEQSVAFSAPSRTAA